MAGRPPGPPADRRLALGVDGGDEQGAGQAEVLEEVDELLLAAVDTEGKPSVGYRARRAAKKAANSTEKSFEKAQKRAAKAQKKAAKQAAEARKAAKKQARNAKKQAKKVTS